MISLLYVSYSLLDAGTADEAIEDIVKTSIAHNKSQDITGALIFTGTNFAQFLEGPDQAILDLMDSIRRDERHKDVWVVLQRPFEARRFGNWSMAYGGRSGFVTRHITDLLSTSAEETRAKAAEKIIEMMEEFAA